MIHVPLQCAILFAYHTLGYSIPFTSAWFLAAYGSGVLFTAWLMHRYYEAPARSFLRRRLAAARGFNHRLGAIGPRSDSGYA